MNVTHTPNERSTRMVLRRAVGIALAAIALIGVARELGAQPFTVTNNGQPLAGAEVSAMINGIKRPLGTTNAAGQVTIDMNALNITKGTEVTVWIKTCEDGTVQIIMVPPGEEGECTQEGAQEGEGCGCRRAGVIVWGDGPVTIDVGAGRVTQVRSGEGPADGEDHSFADLQIGAMFDYSSFYQLEDTVCGRPGVVSCDTDNGAPGIGGYLDYRFGRSNFGLSLEAHYAKLDAESTTEDGARTSFDVNSWQFQGAGVYNVPLSPRAGWYIRSGYAVMYNEGDAESDSESESRSETGSRWLLGSGFHWPIGERWCARTGADWTTGFDSDDADTNVRWSFAVGLRMDRN